jgi:hypothetical protein
MFTIKHYINIISLLIIDIVTSLFYLKYFDSVIIAGGFFVGFFLIMLLVDKIVKKSSTSEKRFPAVQIIIFFVLTISAVIFSSIAETTDELLNSGQSLISSVLLISLISLTTPVKRKERINISLIAAALLFSFIFLLNGIGGAVFIIYALFRYRNELVKLALFFITTLIFTALLFLLIPVSYLGIDLTTILNVFPIWLIVIFIIVTLYTGWMITDQQELYFTSGLFSFLLAVLFIIYNSDNGLVNSLLSGSDYLPQLFFAVPFCISALKDYEVDRFLGKVMTP